MSDTSITKTTRHRFRVVDFEVRGKKGEGYAYHVFPLVDETNGVWLNGSVLGTILAAYDLPETMPSSEVAAWTHLPINIEIAPPELSLAHIEFIYIQPNNDWTRIFCVEPDKVADIVTKIEQHKAGWVTFEDFSRKLQMINLSQVIRVNVVYD